MITTCKSKPITDHKDLVGKFAKALAHYQVDMIEPLLAEMENILAMNLTVKISRMEVSLTFLAT